MNKILLFAVILALIYLAVFFIPSSSEKFSLDPEKKSQVWRFATYPFAHLNAMHLIENIIGLSLIAFIAVELKTAFSDFSSTYLASGFLSVIPIWLILSFTTLGASNAIFGGFGLISQETKKYNIKGWIIIILLSGLIFIKPILSIGSGQLMPVLQQSIAHFSGLVFGIGFFFLLIKIRPILTKRKRHVLRGDYR